MDDAGQHGGPVPGRRLRPAHQLPGKPRLHRPASQNKARLPHHYGGRQKMTSNRLHFFSLLYMFRVMSDYGVKSTAMKLHMIQWGKKVIFVTF